MHKAIKLKMLKEFKKLFCYLSDNKIISGVVFYILFSAILRLSTNIDICIPCLWSTIFDLNCLGCGLTRAFIALLRLDFASAFDLNPLIFIVVPAGVLVTLVDYRKWLYVICSG